MSLSLALVFHFNQHTNQFSEVASRACYRGLLSVLRAHPGLRFNLHFSGTLLRALNWVDPTVLDLVRAGLADGQFELLGSTYAQNVPYACDDWDNAQQIGLHRAVLHDLFGAAPTVFWNSERCWRQSLVPVIAAGGYTVVPVEDHILRAAGLPDPVPARTTHAGSAITAVWDDPVLRERLNYAAWFGRRAQFFNYLEQCAARPGSADFLLAYAEDAEAMGLWPWEAGYLPQATWANLDKLLTEIETRAAVSLVHLSSARPRRDLEYLPDGAARWMDRALRRPDAPYHEDGYEHWFDFLHRSPKIQHFRKLYSVVRTNLLQVGEARQDSGYLAAPPAADEPAHAAARQFYRQAIETFCSHQYEFGCIGVGARGYWGWENVRAAFLYARLAEIAEAPEPRRWIEDLNGDGSDEQILCDGRQVAVFTAFGGRLLGWFDLTTACQWVGNPLAVPPATYVSGASEHPRLTPLRRRWLPDTFDADLRPWREQKTKELAPTRLGRHLAPELFARETDELTVYLQPAAPNGTVLPLPAQIGALNDWVSVDDGPELPADGFLDYRFEPDGSISYLNALLPDLRIDKRLRLASEGVVADYTFQNLADRPRRLQWRLSSELAPDYSALLSGGRSALEVFQDADGGLGVRNTRTAASLVYRPSRAWAGHSHSPVLLGLDLALRFELDLAAGATEAVSLTLAAVRDESGPA